MKDFLLFWKDPVFLKYLMIFGGVIAAFNLIRLLVVICKAKQAETYLYHAAEAFDGMAMGCGVIAFSGFMGKMTVVGIIAAVFAFVFFCIDRKFTWLRHNDSAKQEVQSMLDCNNGGNT